MRSVHAAAVLLLIVAAASRWVFADRGSENPLPSASASAPWFTPVLATLAAFLVLSTLLADDFVLQAGMSTRRLLTGMAVAWFVARSVSTRDERRLVLTMFVIGATAASCLGLLQLLFSPSAIESLFWGRPTNFGNVERLTLPFGHANVAAAHLSLAVVFGTGLIIDAPTRPRRATMVAATVICGGALTLTYSRSGMLATAAGLTAAWVLCRPSRRPGDHPNTSPAHSVPIVVLVALAVIAGANPSWRLRLQSPPPAHWYQVEIDAPALASPGSTFDVSVANRSEVAWTGSPDESLEVTTFDVAGNEVGSELLVLPPLRPSEEAPIAVTVDGIDLGAVRFDVFRPGEGRFTRLAGLPTITTGIGLELTSRTTPAAPTSVVPGPLGRTTLWPAALTLARERPITGVGVGNFRLHYQSVVGVAGPATSHAHSLVLEPLASWGIPATTAFLMLLVGSFLHALGWRRNDGTSRRSSASGTGRDSLDAAALAGLVTVAVMGLFDWTIASASGGLSLWILVGLLQGRHR